MRALFLILGKRIIFRTSFIFKENKMLPNKFIDSQNIRNRKDLGCHLIQLPYITDEVLVSKRHGISQGNCHYVTKLQNF